MKKTKERGIALITLVITIIVLLILAGVSIGGLNGKRGIVTNIDNDKQELKIAELKTKIQQKILEEQAKSKTGIITIEQFKSILEQNGTLSGTDSDDIFSRILKVTEDEDIYEIAVNDIWIGIEDKVSVTPAEPNDIVGPEISKIKLVSDGTKINITVTAQDVSGIAKYVYYIKKKMEPDSNYVEKVNSTSNTATISNLEEGIAYIVKVEVYDSINNKSQAIEQINV